MAILLELITSLIPRFQLYVTMLNVHGEYLTRRKKVDFIIRASMIQVCFLTRI